MLEFSRTRNLEVHFQWQCEEVCGPHGRGEQEGKRGEGRGWRTTAESYRASAPKTHAHSPPQCEESGPGWSWPREATPATPTHTTSLNLNPTQEVPATRTTSLNQTSNTKVTPATRSRQAQCAGRTQSPHVTYVIGGVLVQDLADGLGIHWVAPDEGAHKAGTGHGQGQAATHT